MRRYVPVGISNNELFVTDDVDHKNCLGHMIFCVIRPVTQYELEQYQSDDSIYEYCEDLWRERVQHDKDYTGGLDDFVEMVKSEMGSDGEDYPFKDESFCDVFYDYDSKIYQPLPEWEDYYFYGEYGIEYDEEGRIMPLTLRQFVDMWVEYNTGEEIGTWEASGCYPPHNGNDLRTYVEFDYVLNKKVAEIWYKQVKLR